MTAIVERDAPTDLTYTGFDIVVMAASSGGLRAYQEIFKSLPAHFSASVVLVQHRDPRRPELFERIIADRSRLPVKPVEDGEEIQPATVYIAPPDLQVLVTADRRLVLVEPTAGRSGQLRCQADPLFESVARVYGERAIAVVLTGNLSDGATGVRLVKRLGGRVLVQDQTTAERFSMPSASIATGCIDFVLPLNRISDALVTLVMSPGASEFFRVPLAPWARAALSA
jgi:two-component system, chemotaxis family, protein-glutamate methylesterase/glutaminase